MRVTILGCGGSNGVPAIGGKWGACDPANPKNRRRRPSVLVEWDSRNVLIDTSPDLRDQLLDAGVARVDAVLYTHVHADHVHGIDDLRSVRRQTKRDIAVHGEAPVIDAIVRRFGYLFHDAGHDDGIYRPVLTASAFDGPFEVGGRTVVRYAQDHGICAWTGYRLGPFAYSTDVVALGDDAFAAFAGVDVWVVDCLRIGPAHPTHAHLDRTLEWIERVRPARAVLTHMNHQTDYDTIAATLPDGVEPAYDGMVIEIED